MELTDWSDLRNFDTNFFFGGNATTAATSSKAATSSTKTTTETKKTENQEEVEKSEQADSSNFEEVSDWSDLRKFDDDHDDDWFKAQERKLAEQYGGTFIKVKYFSNGRVAYFCDLCFAECNAKKSLELHCAGMKHLKKKDIWEKEGKLPAIVSADDNASGSIHPPHDSYPPGDGRGLSRPRGSRTGFGFSRYKDKEDSKYEGGGRGRGYNRFVREEDPRDNYYRPYSPAAGGYDDRESRRGYPSPERSFNSFTRRDNSRGGRMLDDNSDDRKPVRPRYYGDSIPERGFGNKSNKDNRSGYERSRSRSFERDARGSRRSPNNYRDSRKRSPYRAPAPPSPPRMRTRSRSKEVEENKVNLVTSPAGSLLQKLAQCCVKSSDDADVALNVVASLTKSLKEYSQRNNEMKIAELLKEAELKVGTVKALKVGMKMLSNFADNTSNFKKSDDFFNTLTESTNQSLYNPSNSRPEPVPPPGMAGSNFSQSGYGLPFYKL